MTDLEKAIELGIKHARQYHHNSYPDYSDNNEYVFSNKEIENACVEMAEWKDDIIRGFLFELSMLLTEPKTDIERAICFALPMSGLNAIDEVGDFLREKFWEYEHKGTILKNE